jgi:hypothetical protein
MKFQVSRVDPYDVIGVIKIPTNWELNQRQWKPDGRFNIPNGSTMYWRDPPRLQTRIKGIFVDSVFTRAVTDHHESMSFVSRSRSQAVGVVATGGALGDISPDNNVNLKAAPYNFTADRWFHGGIWWQPLQKVFDVHQRILQSFDITPTTSP